MTDNVVMYAILAMATYSADNAGFDPTASDVSSVPINTNLQTAMAAAWHS